METNIALLDAAREALSAIQAVGGGSRDATVRRLLEEHVGDQEERADGEQLTHISTVLRHPLPPLDRREAYPAAPLRLRLSTDLLERARAVSLRLPGQPPRRGGRDYQARPLTDAVVTAIARHEPILDPALEGLMPIIRHDAAVGLWRLAVAATATKTETALFTRTQDPLATRDRVLQELLFNQVAWHSDWRLEVLWILAQYYLAGPGAEAAEQMLFEQGKEFEFAWSEQLHRTGLEDGGLQRIPEPSSSHEGRAGGAVWRARRAAEKVDFVEWLAGENGGSCRRMTPPGWGLRVPSGWVGMTSRIGSPELQRLRPWVEQGQVLQFPIGSRVLVWPLEVTADGARLPVPGLGAVLAELNRMPAVAAAELILRDHRDPSVDEADDYDVEDDDDGDGDGEPVDEYEDESNFWGPVEVPAHVARRLDLIDEAAFGELLRDAETTTRQDMADALAALPREFADEELTAAMSFPALFNDLLHRRVGSVVRETKPRWIWPVISLADQVVRGSSPQVLVWLTQQLRWRYDQELWGSEYQAWKDASARYNW